MGCLVSPGQLVQRDPLLPLAFSVAPSRPNAEEKDLINPKEGKQQKGGKSVMVDNSQASNDDFQKPSRTKHSFSKSHKSKADNFCTNCQVRFENLVKHLEQSFICKQTLHQGFTKKFSEADQSKKGTKNAAQQKPMKVKCKGCHKEFVNIKMHVSKSFPCQNQYRINQVLNND